MQITNRDQVEAFVTKDTSIIREIIAPRNAPLAIRRQSLAEATLPPNASTQPHYHPVTEEIYYILQGQARMRIGKEICEIGPGDAVAIPPGAAHQITNLSAETDLVFLCCCAPAYEHHDTVMTTFTD
jgi:mannose-6-phosphate isomerase-like protein (cupin superfamily)